MKVLVLCHGNMNRSPACEAVLLAPLGRDNVRSRGFKISAGRAAKKMRDAMSKRGYDLSHHRPVAVTRDDAEWADVVILMDGGNLRRWEELFPDLCDGVVNLGTFVGRTRIPDPGFMRRGSIEFEQVVDLLVDASLNFAKSLGDE